MRNHDFVRRSWSPSVLLVAVAVAVSVSTGCASLPNVAPFTDATVKLTSATKSVGDVTVEEMRRASATVLPQNKEQLDRETKRLVEAWAKYVVTLEAASDYARSLQSVVDAANQAQQSVQNVADAAKSLASTVGVQIGPGVSIATNALSLAYSQIATARGRQTLIEAMDDLAPAIDQIALVIENSLDDLDKIVDSATQLQINALRSDLQTELGYRTRLVEDRAALYEKGWSKLSLKEKGDLKSIEEALAATESWYSLYLQRSTAITIRRAEYLATITAIRRGVMEWAATHSRLRIALKQGNQIDTAALLDTVMEIRGLVERIRAR